MNAELRERLEVLALELACKADGELAAAIGTAGRHERAHLRLASQLARSAAMCAGVVHEAEWVSAADDTPMVVDSSYEELKSLVVPLAQAYASWGETDRRDKELAYLARRDSGADGFTHGQMRRLCRAVGVEVPDASA